MRFDLKVIFGASGHQRLNFNGFIYSRYAVPQCHLIPLILFMKGGCKTPILFFDNWHSSAELNRHKIGYFSSPIFGDGTHPFLDMHLQI